MGPIKFLLLLSIFFVSCKSNKEQAPKPDISFDKTKWNARGENNYTYRRQMVNDLLNNYKWEGVSKDSLLQMLGQPDDIEGEVMMIYYYEQEPKMLGTMESHRSITFELAADRTKIKTVKQSMGTEWK